MGTPWWGRESRSDSTAGDKAVMMLGTGGVCWGPLAAAVHRQLGLEATQTPVTYTKSGPFLFLSTTAP